MRPKRVKAGTSTHTSIAWMLIKVFLSVTPMTTFFQSLQNLQMSPIVHLLPTPRQSEQIVPSRKSKQSLETGLARRCYMHTCKCPSMVQNLAQEKPKK